ncbi:S24 family peptidase, partial [Azospirillum brasilense]|uniref:S24 family peptidase n=2 Tax=Pseudomonadota TaxID=1224 RepID=UPI0009C645A9
FLDGDVLLVDAGVRTLEVDGVYVLAAQNRLFIKRVRQRLDGAYEISSDNPTVKTVDVLDGKHAVEILGKVIWIWNGRKI